MARPDPLAGFEREVHTVNGVKTVVLSAGRGDPLVFLHGASTWHGFEFALPWAEKYPSSSRSTQVSGEFGDDRGLSDMHDYVLHYLDLLDALAIDKFRLVGFSLGGLLAAKFAVEHGRRVEHLHRLTMPTLLVWGEDDRLIPVQLAESWR